MIVRRRLGPAVVAAASVAMFVALQGRPAAAQLFWDWSGGTTVGGSGREAIAFNPQYSPGQIIVSFGDRKLYYITQPGQAISYPIAIPREQSRWQGVSSVSQKRESPSWTPTPAMLAENPRLPRWVPGGHPMNPLGVRALYLGNSMYRIHGTDAPWTIGTAVSKGCIRLYNQDVLDLYPRVNMGAKVTVTYQTFTTTGAPGAPGVPSAISSLSKTTQQGLGNFLFGEEEPARPARRAAPRAKAKSKASAPAKPVAQEARRAEQKAAASAAIGPAPVPAVSATPGVIETAAPKAAAE